MAEEAAVRDCTHANTSIEIHQCKNGFLVMPSQNWYRNQGMMTDFGVLHVFQSFEAMNEWLYKHFDHRSYKVPHDAK
jgi:hypothetical protein